MDTESSGNKIETTFAIIVMLLADAQAGEAAPADLVSTSAPAWQILDQGPGIFHIPPAIKAGVRARSLDDRALSALVAELQDVSALRFLNLAENRGVTDSGMARLSPLRQLEYLNLSSCDITAAGMAHLKNLPNLTHLDLSFCNRITDAAIKDLRALPRLEFLNIHACFKITKAGFRKLERRGLEIKR